MKTQIKIIRFWVAANYNQIFIITAVLYFAGRVAVSLIFKK